MNSLPQTSNLQQIAEEIDQALTEGIFNSNWELIKAHHHIGKLILEQDVYSAVPALARLSERSERTLYRSVQFVRKYPDINALPEGKIITWNKIVTKYLPDKTTECEHEPIQVTICRRCQKRL